MSQHHCAATPHTWSTGADGDCRHCQRHVTTGERYVCVTGGVAHLTCRASRHHLRLVRAEHSKPEPTTAQTTDLNRESR